MIWGQGFRASGFVVSVEAYCSILKQEGTYDMMVVLASRFDAESSEGPVLSI